MAISGTTLAVSNGGSNNYDGLIWVYTWNGTSWTLQTTLSGPAGRLIGDSLAFEGDYLVTSSAVSNSSMGWTAYVFERSGTSWTRRELVGSDRAADDRFGSAVGISGNAVCVGAPGASSPAVMPGAVHVFRRGASNWTQEGPKLTPSTTNGARVGAVVRPRRRHRGVRLAVFT